MPDFQSSPLVPKNLSIRFGTRLVNFLRPKVMGIINLTSDSFYSGSRVETDDELIKMADSMLMEGADFLDVGGYSTRPGAGFVEEKTELKRVCTAIALLRKKFPQTLISVDTFRAGVAREALDEGADWVNDVSGGLENEKMWEVVSERKVPYILMHIRKNVAGMHQSQTYKDVPLEVSKELAFQVQKATAAGIHELVLDPGFGFSKNPDQNFQLLNGLEQFHRMQKPVLVGISRKSMIYKTLGVNPEEAIIGTTALHAVALLKGAHILRVHDVKPAIQTIRMIEKLCLQE